MYRGQVTFEYVRTVEAFFGCGSRSWAEITDHRALVMRQSVSVLVVLASKALLMVLARDNRTLFWSFRLMG